MINLQNPEIQFAINAVGQAALLAQQVQRELASNSMTKEDRSPVTVGDLASQALVSYLLSRSFPADPLVAEEDSAALRRTESKKMLEQVTEYVHRFLPVARPETVCDWIDRGRMVGPGANPGRFWTFDPIDGTKGYLREGQYAVALALVAGGQVQVGVLGCPNLIDGYRPELDGAGSLVIAARGQGTWTTPLTAPGQYERLHVSTRRSPNQARLLRSWEDAHTNPEQLQELVKQLGIPVEPVRMDSQAKYAVLAAGKADVVIRLLTSQQPNYKEKIWDQAAGEIVVTEAGGCLTDLYGERLDFTTGRTLAHNTGALATNGYIHAAFVEAIKSLHHWK